MFSSKERYPNDWPQDIETARLELCFRQSAALSDLLENVLAAMEITSNPIKNKKNGRGTDTNGITEDQMNRNINKLSGGEQQRVAIARAISTMQR